MHSGSKSHYLERELTERIQNDPEIFRFLEQGSLDGIWYWDLEQPEHEWMSPRFWAALGYDPLKREHLASEWQDLIHPEDLKTALQNFRQHCDDPAYPYDQVVRYRASDGGWTWVRCRGLVIRDDNGTPIRMLGAHNDITVLKRQEERLKEQTAALAAANARLAESNADLEAFSMTAAHDLQGPLRVMSSFASFILEDDEGISEQSRAHLDQIVSAGQRMSRMISSLLEFSRVRDSETSFSQVQLDAVIERSADPYPEIEVSIGKLPSAFGDESLIERLFANIISNAQRYRAPDRPPTLHISGHETSEQVSLQFRDNGRGIPDGMETKAVELFGRCHRKSEHPDACGMGLAICRRITEIHGGSLYLKNNEDGVGLTVYVKFATRAAARDEQAA